MTRTSSRAPHAGRAAGTQSPRVEAPQRQTDRTTDGDPDELPARPPCAEPTLVEPRGRSHRESRPRSIRPAGLRWVARTSSRLRVSTRARRGLARLDHRVGSQRWSSRGDAVTASRGPAASCRPGCCRWPGRAPGSGSRHGLAEGSPGSTSVCSTLVEPRGRSHRESRPRSIRPTGLPWVARTSSRLRVSTRARRGLARLDQRVLDAGRAGGTKSLRPTGPPTMTRTSSRAPHAGRAAGTQSPRVEAPQHQTDRTTDGDPDELPARPPCAEPTLVESRGRSHRESRPRSIVPTGLL
jgi:hypothetical protein